jgi:hypothetical protein
MHFWCVFGKFSLVMPGKGAERRPLSRRWRRSARLTSRQRAGAFCIDPEPAGLAGAHLHQFKTTARIALPR